MTRALGRFADRMVERLAPKTEASACIPNDPYCSNGYYCYNNCKGIYTCYYNGCYS